MFVERTALIALAVGASACALALSWSASADLPTEAEVRAACAAGDATACGLLGGGLASGAYGDRRGSEAMEPLLTACRGEVKDACLLALLLHREGSAKLSAEVERDVLVRDCAQASTSSCLELGGKHRMARAWEKMCAYGNSLGCALQQGTWPPAGAEVGPWTGLTLSAAHKPSLPLDFERRLEAGKMVFTMPAGFQEVRVEENPHAPYLFAIATADRALEVRFNVVPVSAWREQFDCGRNDDCLAMTNSLGRDTLLPFLINVSNGNASAPRELKPLAVRAEFDAQWAKYAAFQPREAWTRDHTSGVVLQLHRDDAADAYVTFLYSGELPVAFQAAFHALRFSEPVGTAGAALDGASESPEQPPSP